MVTESDFWLIDFTIKTVTDKIKNKCNITSIPEGLYTIAIDMTCGEILLALKSTGKLNETFDIDGAIKQVQLGDTNVTFIEDGTPENRLDALITYLTNKEGDLICYRKLKW